MLSWSQTPMARAPPETTLADHGGDDGGLQARHDAQVPGDGLALATLFGVDARVGAGGIDEGQDRHLEALGHSIRRQALR